MAGSGRHVAKVEYGSIPENNFRPYSDGRQSMYPGTAGDVGTVVDLWVAGPSADWILAAYSYLEQENFDQSLAYAAWRLEEREVPLFLP